MKFWRVTWTFGPEKTWQAVVVAATQERAIAIIDMSNFNDVRDIRAEVIGESYLKEEEIISND